jgi:hypothetical protein
MLAELTSQSAASRWSQTTLIDPSSVRLDLTLFYDGPAESLCASATLRDFATCEQLACEVRPGLRFPQDLDIALAWLEQLARHFAARVSPF